ncbi:MAG: sigma-70 family RNA polymerase sigma factor [Chloroflexota bacterium]|nr:sigma-70 family RNA polymerase sigma factor [Chloroflexota bacterium]
MRDDVTEMFTGGELSDEELAVLVARGDEAALEGLYDRYKRPVFSLLLRMVGDRQVGEDLAQEVFLRVWRHACTYDPGKGRFSGWIFQIAHRAALDEIRRQAARPRRMRDDPARPPCVSDVADASPGPEEMCVMGDHREGIVVALSRLPVVQRETIEMAYFDGLKQSEIAELQRVPLGTVKTRTRLALERLRSHLEA